MADDESFQHEITLGQVDEGRRLYQNYIKKRSVRQYVPARADIPCSPDDDFIDHGGNTVDDHDHARAVTQADPAAHSEDERERAKPDLRMSPEKLPFSYPDIIPPQGRQRTRPVAVPTWTGSPLLDSDAVIPKGSCAHCLGQGHSARHCPHRK